MPEIQFECSSSKIVDVGLTSKEEDQTARVSKLGSLTVRKCTFVRRKGLPRNSSLDHDEKSAPSFGFPFALGDIYGSTMRLRKGSDLLLIAPKCSSGEEQICQACMAAVDYFAIGCRKGAYMRACELNPNQPCGGLYSLTASWNPKYDVHIHA